MPSNSRASTVPYFLQGSVGGVKPTGLTRVSSPLLVPQDTGWRMRSFSPDVYNLSPQSHLVKLMRVLLGSAGTGQLRSRFLLKRLEEGLTGTFFYNLDAFWGSIFGVTRTPEEVLVIDPSRDLGTSAQWASVQAADQSYRSRIFQFGRAIALGPCPAGIEAVAESILQCPVDVYEGYVGADFVPYDWNHWDGTTWSVFETNTWDEVEGYEADVPGSVQDMTFVLRPHRSITLAERYALYQVLSIVKPADSILAIDPEPPVVYAPVSLRGAWASSSYWEVRRFVGGSETLRPAFAAHQAESWTYAGDISALSSYHLDHLSAALASQDYERIVWTDGTHTDFGPSAGLTTSIEANLARIAGDAVTSTPPLIARGSDPITVVPVFVDGEDQSDVAVAVANVTGVVSRQSEDLRFWSTPRRLSTDLTFDVMEVDFTLSHVVNSITLELAHYPQFVSVQVYDASRSRWTEVYSQAVSDSVPAFLPADDASSLAAHLHPQHSFVDHWMPVSITIAPFETSKMRVVLTRGTTTSPQVAVAPLPGASSNQPTYVPVPYSLGVRRLNVGYAVSSTSDLPFPLTGDGVIDASADFQGRQTIFALAQDDPESPLTGDGAWRSDAQPLSNAVANFFVDGRDADGDPQTIDSFFLDPTHLGFHATVYHSEDDVPDGAGFSAADTPVPFSATTTHGDVAPAGLPPTGLQFSKDSAAYVDVTNEDLQWDPSKSWWTGMRFTDRLGSGVDHPIFDFGVAALFVGGDELWLRPANGDAPVGIPVSYAPNTDLSVVVGWLSESTPDFSGGPHWVLGLAVLSGVTAGQATYSGSASTPSGRPSSLRIGGVFSGHNTIGSGTSVFLDFEGSDPSVPTVTSGGSLVVSTDFANTGTHSLEGLGVPAPSSLPPLFDFGVTTGGGFPITQPTIACSPGDVISLSYAERPAFTGPGGSVNNLKLGCIAIFVDSSGNPVSSVTPPSVDTTNDTWTTYSATLSPAPTGSAALFLVAAFASAIWDGTYDFHAYIDTVSVINTSAVTTFDLGASGIVLKEMVLKTALLDAATIEGWHQSPVPYAAKSGFRGIDGGLTNDAYLRFDPSFVSPDNLVGLVGGPPYFCDSLSWTPIPRDYVLTTGFVQFPPTSARFWKFELTNLAPEPFDHYISVPREVLTFPPSPNVSTPGVPPVGYRGDRPQGTDTMVSLASGQSFNASSAPPSITSATSPAAGDFQATEALVASDPSVAQNVGLQSWIYNLQSPDQGLDAPRFVTPGLHLYSRSTVLHSGKTAYFAGFKRVEAFRLDPHRYQASDDTPLYDEGLFDSDWAVPGYSFTLARGDLFTPGSAGGTGGSTFVAESQTYFSRHDVEGVQFATQQNPPVQIVQDDDFTESSLLSAGMWSADGWNQVGDALFAYDATSTALVVTRNQVATPSELVAPPEAIVVPPVYPVMSMLTGSGGPPVGSSGGVQSSLCSTGVISLLHVAVRFTALGKFTAPVFVELRNSSDDVIASWQVSEVPGHPVEQYWTIDLQQIGEPTQVSVAMVQYGRTSDSWTIDALSIFDDGFVWSFSGDGGTTWVRDCARARNNPSGVVTLTTPGDQLRWRVQCNRTDMHVNYLRMRPIYTGRLPFGAQGVLRGPNLSPQDHLPDVFDDPLFGGWQIPVPREWFAAYRLQVRQ